LRIGFIMDELDYLAFAALFKEAFQKCFGLAFANPISETEAKLFCNNVLDQTGLSIGWKSLKNYSIFIADGTAGRQENPSAATYWGRLTPVRSKERTRKATSPTGSYTVKNLYRIKSLASPKVY